MYKAHSSACAKPTQVHWRYRAWFNACGNHNTLVCCSVSWSASLAPLVNYLCLLLRLSLFLRQLLRLTNRLHNTHRVEQELNQYSQDGPSLHILPLHQQRKLGRYPRLKHYLLFDPSPSHPWTSWRLRHQKRGLPHQDGSQQLKSCHSFQQLQVTS